eukprot:UN25960
MYSCDCPYGFLGVNCEETKEVDHCHPVNPCKNGGQCSNEMVSYFCDCKNGFTGNNCETPAGCP